MDTITMKRVLKLEQAIQECDLILGGKKESRRMNRRLKEEIRELVHKLAREAYIVKERQLDALKKKIKKKPAAAKAKAAMKSVQKQMKAWKDM